MKFYRPKSRIFRTVSGTLFVWSVLLVLSSTSCTKNNDVQVSIIHMNDVYEIAPVNQGKEGGYARVAYLIDSLKKQNPNTIVLHAGDFLSPSLIGNLKDENGQRIKGKHMVEVMNASGVDYVTFGNHEFDLKESELLQRISESNFGWISANVFHRKDSLSVVPFYHKGKPIPKLVKVPFANKEDTFWLGITAVTLPFNQKEFVYYEDYEMILEQVLDSTTADTTVLLSHLNRNEDTEVAQRFSLLPLIMGGHDHYHFMDTFKTTVVAKADANLRTIWKHDITYNRRSKTCKIQSTLIPITSEIPEKPQVKALVDKWLQFAEQKAQESGFDVNRIIWQGNKVWECRETEVRSGQTNFGNAVANAMKEATGAEVAFLNSGSLRYDDQLTGSITEKDILKALPFGGEVVLAEILGEDLEGFITLSEAHNVGTGGYLQIPGIELDGKGGYIVNDKPLDPHKNYTVVTSGFMAAGRENNLEGLKNYAWIQSDSLQGVPNDIRHLVIRYFSELDL